MSVCGWYLLFFVFLDELFFKLTKQTTKELLGKNCIYLPALDLDVLKVGVGWYGGGSIRRWCFGFNQRRQEVTIMGHIQQFHESESTWDDGIFVPFGMTPKEMCLDLIHITRFGDARDLVYFATKIE
jgi:hypothetical protein